MGYFLMFQDYKKQKYYHYSDDFDDLLDIVRENVVIVKAVISEGQKHEATPASHKPYEIFLIHYEKEQKEQEIRRKNGKKAQKNFKDSAIKKKFIVEGIPQGVKSFPIYNIMNSLPVKRADFIIKNCDRIEVEVKCLTFYTIDGNLFFYISYYEVKALNRLNKLTNQKTILAIYDQKTINSENKSLIMIELDTIVKENKQAVTYDEETKCFKVPLHLTSSGFELLENYRIKKELY